MCACPRGCPVGCRFDRLKAPSGVEGQIYFQGVLLAILRGEFAIPGLSNKRLRAVLGQKTSAQIARILRRLRNHRLIKRVAHTYRYYLSALGQRLILAARKIFEHGLIPNLQP